MGILVATDLLYKHQWAGTAHGGYGSLARMCPECQGIHPADSLNNGGGDYTRGKGHKPGCAIAGALVGYNGEHKGEESRPDPT